MHWLHLFLFWLALVTLLGVLATCLEFAWGHNKIKALRDLPPLEGSTAPKVSVIAAGRNEERNVEEAVRSLLSFDYPNYEVILVNDRSTDRTGEILDRLALETGDVASVMPAEEFRGTGGTPAPPSQERKLRVVHIQELPAGWLGKNHALQQGADTATGDFLLFTDADVVMEPSSLRRAVRFMQETKMDHLAAGPNVNVRGAWLNIFCGGFAVFFAMFVKPWKVSNPKSKAHIGIGAFNLIRAEVYRKMGAHRAIAMRVDDDLKLGKLVKKNGFRQDCVAGRGMIFVEWYASFGDAVRGLTKNMFAGVEYSVAMVVASTIAMFLLLVFPFAGALITSGWTQLMFAAAAVALWLLACSSAYHNGIRWYYGLGLPLAVVMFLFILWRSTLVTLKNDGVNWRGTHYSLSELRANKV
jgi:cellulose synthase/poly-beta-1,6-N-acetylglucosamine synthase-like glycosyltransferase